MTKRRPLVLDPGGCVLSEMPTGDMVPVDTVCSLENTMRLWFCEYLTDRAPDVWSPAQVDAGLLPGVFTSLASLPIPANINDPAFAIVDLGGEVQLAFWNYNAGSDAWQVTSKPFLYPFTPLVQEYLIDQVGSAGAGNNAWQFVVGCVFNVDQACEMIGYAVKMNGTATFDRRVSLSRSTVPGPGAPPIGSFTDQIFDENFNKTAASNVWEDVPLGTPIVMSPNEVYYLSIYVLQGGQFEGVAAMRTQGELNETFATLLPGAFTFVGATNPAGPTPPTNYSGAGNSFGMITPLLEG